MTLTPLGDNGFPSHCLIQLHSHPSTYQQQSPNITDSVTLGRNSSTNIQDVCFSRNLLKVWITQDGQMKLSINPEARKISVTVNGKTIGNEIAFLHQDDVLALHGKYRYQISLQELPGKKEETEITKPSMTMTAMTTTTIVTQSIEFSLEEKNWEPSANGTNEVKQHALQQVCHALLCSVCMDIMVHTVAFNPCGHLFCSSCVQPKTPCPTCRVDVMSVSSSKRIDEVILHLVKSGSFAVDDVKFYIEWMGEMLSDLEWACVAGSSCSSGEDQAGDRAEKVGNSCGETTRETK